MEVTKEFLDSFYACIKTNTFCCSVCGKIIFPEIEINKENVVTLQKETTSAYGGKGNKKTLEDVCSDCAKRMENILLWIKRN